MGISYDPPSKKWNIVYEKTDRPTNLPENISLITSVNLGPPWGTLPLRSLESIQRDIDNFDPGSRSLAPYYKNLAEYKATEEALAKNKSIELENKYNAEINAANLKTNVENTAKNAAYDKTQQIANTTKEGDYVTQREAIRNLQGIDDTLKSTLENNFKASYLTEKLQAWDGSKLGAKPAYGDFDPSYYVKQNPDLKAQWEAYKANDDVDVVNRYGENNYYYWHYTNQGKRAGFRGNAAEATAAANQY